MDVSLEVINPSSARPLIVACLTLLLSFRLWRWLRQRSIPGPLPWPLIGNAAQMGQAPHLYFARMAKKYGDVFQIRLGCRNVVVLNGDCVKQALVGRGFDFAGRPDFTSYRFVSNGNSIAFNTVSDWWKLHRKLAQSTVRMFSTGNLSTKKTFEHHVVCEVRELLRLFLQKTAEEGHFEPMTYLVVSTANIMSAVCFGKRYTYEDEEFRQVVGRNDQFTRTVGAGSMVDVMPWLQYFPNPIKTLSDNFKALNQEFSAFVVDKVAEHRKTIRPGAARDVTDAFIEALDQLRDHTGLSSERDYVAPTLSDVFGASQDTLSTALQWIVLILAKYPEVQTRLQQEVDKVVDRSRLPTIEDQARLPYVAAFVHEMMRFTSFTPLTIPHSTTADTSILGYAIPKDTVVFINQWSTNHNPAIWSHPETFDPQRFLDGAGALNKDRTSRVLLFSMGKRRCIGEGLSKMKLSLFTALLAHQCRVAADPARPPELDYDYGLTLKPRPFSIAVSLRDDMALLDAAAGRGPKEEVRGEPSSG
ncbi:cytochrome P450 1B1 isoform X2 [Betta splendens]|nr:cytochrome P450 1B1 isoform X2 [Betta splendens]